MNEVWLETLQKIIDSDLVSKPRGFEIKEILNNQMKIDMHMPILSVIERNLGYKFMAREAWWIMDGKNDVESIKDYSRAISKFSDDGYHFNGAYGPRLVDQWHYIVDSLISDIDTRQAVSTIWRPNPRASKDIPCTISVQWLIRNNKIYCIDNMRSSDIWLGVPYDVFNFTMLTGYLMLLLREKGLDNLELGYLYLNAGSRHLYENNFESAIDVLNNRVCKAYQYFNPYEFDSPLELKHYLKALSEKDSATLNKYNSTFGRDILCA
ncbi:thymidylate synthase [Faecalibacillus faecis]|uniref:thymidylate synthase n=1 Tax=Faecalibacillus faecis TaxID=1982628 RepID=UPI00386EE0A6